MRESLASLLDRAFRGLTPALLGACLLYVVFNALFSWPVANAVGSGSGLAQLAQAFGRVLLADTLRLLPLFAAVAAFNLASGRWSTRATIAMAVLAAGTGAATYATCPVLDLTCPGGSKATRALLGMWVHYFVIPALFALILMLVARDNDARSVLDRQRLQVIELDRGLAEARLKVTQAQIEPHFLFNTLANIRRLYDVEPKTGKAMLEHFAAMLASTLPTMRDARSTLGQEIAYASAYLNVQQIRMGHRLRFSFDVPEALRKLDFPPMMLLTLIENAIKHGIGPLPQGGTIKVEASREYGVLRVRVTDSGRGLASASGSGVGLANIEARLRAAEAGTGRLVLEENAGGGVSATIDVALAA
jgi:hypothetical protein